MHTNWHRYTPSLLLLALLLIIALPAVAGGADVSSATYQVSDVYKKFKPIGMWVAGICAVIGATEVFSKFSHGDHDAKRSLIIWSSAVFITALFPSVLDVIYRPHASSELASELGTSNTAIRNGWSHMTKIMFSFFGIYACLGAIAVYSRWQAGDPDTQRLALYWIGSLFFGGLVLGILESGIFGTL